MTEIPELTEREFRRAIKRSQRDRLINGQAEPGDIAALRLFVGLTQAEFAQALGISVSSLGGKTPAEVSEDSERQQADLRDYRWASHCDGLMMLPIAA